MPKKYLAYCRVSTHKQAKKENSIPIQRKAIKEYATRNNLQIAQWYQEASSAFKGKRKEFFRMMLHLEEKDITGVIFHRIDRSTRNIRDRGLLMDIAETGKEIITVDGGFDLSEVEGQFMFDVTGAVNRHSSNLRRNIKTTFQKILKEGYYPTQTPIGYRPGLKSKGENPKKKYPDETLAPFVKESFTNFATGNYSIRSLCNFMQQKGMTNKNGSQLRKNVFERLLNDTFYHGLISWGKRQGQIKYYEGNHQPLISKQLFDKVQNILKDRTQKQKTKHDFTYAKMIKCECGNYLISSIHKNHIYLECQSKNCNFTSIRQDRLEDQIIIHLAKYEISTELKPYYLEALNRLRQNIRTDNKAKRQALNLQLARLEKKLNNLHEAILDGVFVAEEALKEKNAIIAQRHIIRTELAKIEDQREESLWETTREVLELFELLPYRYKEINPFYKRDLLNFLFLNRQLKGSKLLIKAIPVFENLKISQHYLIAQKAFLNRQPQGLKPLTKAESANPKTEKSAVLLNGRDGGTRTHDLSNPNAAR